MYSQEALLSRSISLLLFGSVAVAQMPVLLAQVQSDSLAQEAKAKIDRLEINFKGLHGESGAKHIISGAKGSPYLDTAKPNNFVPNSALLSDEIEPNNHPEQAQVLRGPSPITLNGTASTIDVGALIINFGDANTDDLEDLFSITILSQGLALNLSGHSSDCDLYILRFISPGSYFLRGSTNPGTNEESINLPNLSAGNYLIGVSIFDPDPQGAPSSPYVLTVTGDIADANTSSLITVDTNPDSLIFLVDGASYNLFGQVFNWPLGSSHQLSTPSLQQFSGIDYFFTNWSDGGTQTHAIITPNTDQTITAHFSTQPPQPPDPPSNLQLSNFPTWQYNFQFDLTWKDGSNNEDGFKIERREGMTGSWNQIATAGVNSETYSDTGLTRGTEYCYRVRAFNQSGNSSYSNIACRTTLQVPNQPENLTATLTASGDTIKLQWDDKSDNELYFTIERNMVKDIDTVAAGVTMYFDTDIVDNSIYRYRCRACNNDGCSPGSNEVPKIRLGQPSDCKATKRSHNSITIAWNDGAEGEDGYKIERSLNEGEDDFAIIDSVGVNRGSYTDTAGLTANTMYFYRIWAFSQIGFSKKCALLTATTPVDVKERESNDMPKSFALYENFPNPFNPPTGINYDLPYQSEIQLKIFDVLGKHVRTLINFRQEAGRHSVIWDGRNEIGQMVPAGVYIYQIHTDRHTESRKLLLLR